MRDAPDLILDGHAGIEIQGRGHTGTDPAHIAQREIAREVHDGDSADASAEKRCQIREHRSR